MLYTHTRYIKFVLQLKVYAEKHVNNNVLYLYSYIQCLYLMH